MRRVKDGSEWHTATDCLVGTDTYGKCPDATFSVAFADADFDQFLFITGDLEHWVMSSREAVLGGRYEDAPRPVLASSLNPEPHELKWYRRCEGPEDVNEDPWISVKDHWDEDRGRPERYRSRSGVVLSRKCMPVTDVLIKWRSIFDIVLQRFCRKGRCSNSPSDIEALC